MKAITILILVLVTSEVFSQTGDYLSTDFILSPDKKKAIAIDYYMSESGGHPSSCKLYNMPIDCNKFKILPNSPTFIWSVKSNLIVTQVPFESNIVDNYQRIKTDLIIFNSDGIELKRIRYGTSAIEYSENKWLYKVDFDNNGHKVAPRLEIYDLLTDSISSYYQFADSLSFWGEQVDGICYPQRPKFKGNKTEVELYKIDNPTISYIALIDNKKRLISITINK